MLLLYTTVGHEFDDVVMSGAPVIENLAEARRSGRNLAAQCIAILCQPDELGVPALGPGLSTSAATTNGMPVQRAAPASGGELSVPGTLDVVEFLTRRLEQVLASDPQPTTSAVVGGEAVSSAVAPAVAVAPVSGPRADGSGAEQSEPAPEIRAGC